LIIAGLVVLCALLLKAVTDTMLAYAAQAQAIGDLVRTDADRP
jgi:hypothetical protein